MISASTATAYLTSGEYSDQQSAIAAGEMEVLRLRAVM